MKTRKSLVSNSSSSSFICLVPLEIHNEVLNRIEDYPELKEIAKKYIDGLVTKTNKFGIKMISFCYISGEDCNIDPSEEAVRILTEEERSDIDGDYYYWEWISSYEEQLKEIEKQTPEKVFTQTLHW